MLNCEVCNNKNPDVIYSGKLRTGSFGKQTKEDYNVYSCNHCSCKFIKNILPEDYYQTPEYRLDYNDSVNLEDFYQEHDVIDTNKISKVGLHNLRNKVIADFGTGAGTFLQAVRNISEYTIAIEPSKHFHEILNKNNKHTFSYGEDLVKSQLKIDIATSFDVIEHVPSPKDYLKDIYDSLGTKGKMYLKTPNFNDILHELTPEHFDSFNYRTAHLFYFCEQSLKYLLESVGFKSYKIEYIHDFDISNLLYWMKEAKPTGVDKTKLFDKNFNQMYKNYLEETSKASHLWIVAIK